MPASLLNAVCERKAVLNFQSGLEQAAARKISLINPMTRRVKSSANSVPKRRDAFSDDLYDQPGHLIRRAHQIAVSIFHSTFGYKATPVQYAVLRVLQNNPGIDQVTLARLSALDTSTAANLAVRLERRGLVKRTVPIKSKRFRLLQLTPRGTALVKQLSPSGSLVTRRLLRALDKKEQKVFLHLLKKFVHLNNEESRAPLDREFAQTRNNHSHRDPRV